MKNKKLYLSILFFVLFIVDMILVIMKKTVVFDDEVRQMIIGRTSEISGTFMRVMTFLGSTKWMIGLCAALFFFFLWRKHKKRAFSVASILITSTILNNVVKWIVRRPRPPYMEVEENTFSFPSGHMMASVTLYGFIIYLICKSKISTLYKWIYSILLVLLILFVGASRIYLGAHFASDILGGAFLSLSLLCLFAFLDEKKELVD